MTKREILIDKINKEDIPYWKKQLKIKFIDCLEQVAFLKNLNTNNEYDLILERMQIETIIVMMQLEGHLPLDFTIEGEQQRQYKEELNNLGKTGYLTNRK